MKILPLFIALIMAYCAHAQYPAYTVFGEEQFKGVDIYDVIQDTKDHYYFATDQGIFKHNGYSYDKVSCPEMNGASVFGFVADSKGVIYCFNLHQQIFRIQNGKVSVFYEIPKEGQHHDIWMVVDDEDNLLIQTNGITKITPSGKVTELTSFVFREGGSPINFHLMPDGSTISLASSSIIAHQKDDDIHLKESDLLSELHHKNGNIALYWITIDNVTYAVERKTHNVYKFDLNTLSLKYVRTLSNIHDTDGLRLYTSKDRIWIVGNSNGAYVFNSDFQELYNGEQIYENHFISDVLTDHEGNILLSTFDEGILIIPNNDVLGIQLDGSERITYLASDQENTIFIGSNGGNIYSFDDHELTLNYSDPQHKAVEFISCWPDKNLILHSYGEGLQISSKEGNTFKATSQHTRSIKDAYFNSSEHAIGAFNHGIVNIRLEGGKVSYDVIEPLRKRAYCVVENKNTIYAGLADGLFMFRNGKKELIRYNGDVIYPNSLIVYDDAVFIGTRKHGILIYKNQKLVDHIPFTSRIRKMKIYDGKLFILCTDGLYFGGLGEKTFEKLNNSTGLNCDQISAFEIAHNTLYITNSKVLQFISLDNLFIESKAVPLHFGCILVNDQLISRSTLDPDEHKIQFTFSVSTIRYRDNIQYRYKLIGYDDKWNYNNYDENKITYNALPSGDYEFVVQSINGTAKSTPLTYSFSIKAPFHEQWWFYVLIILFSGLVIAGLYTRRIRQLRKMNAERLEKQKIQTDLLESELKALRSQMNPHFIFNSLNSIQDLILKEDTDASYDYIVLFADLVRSALNYSNKSFIPLEKELEFLNVYLSLEELRFKDDFSYDITYTGKEEIDVPPMLIQPFIENALLHGLLHKSGPKTLKINFEFDGSKLVCTVEDNGIGRKKAKEIGDRQGTKHESFALKAIDKRLAILNERMGEQVGTYDIEDLYPDSEETGTRVIIHLPFKRHF